MPSYKDEKTGTWYCSFYWTNLQGKRVRKLKRGFKLKRDADKFEREWLSAQHGEDITMSVLIGIYEKHLQEQYIIGNIKRSTLYAYTNRIRLYIKPYWEDIIAKKVKPKDVDEWITRITNPELQPLSATNNYYQMIKRARKTRRSSMTVNKARLLLSQIFDFAKKNFNILSNPVDESTTVKKFSQDTRAKYWSLEQYRQFSSSVERKDLKVLYDVLFYAGLRIGEALALTPDDIGEYYLSIDKALVQETYSESYISSPKNSSSIRRVEIPLFLHQSLVELIKSVRGIRHTDIIFIASEQKIRRYLDQQARKLGLPKISPHILRHSYASHLLSLCKDPMVVAKQLGHSSPDTTLKVYAHMIEGNDRAAVDALESFVQNKK